MRNGCNRADRGIKERPLASNVWKEVDVQIGNYVRGQFQEILIASVVTFVVLALMGLKYAMLMGCWFPCFYSFTAMG